MAITLTAQERTVKGKKVKTLRREGIVPAEIYGQGGDNISIQVTEKDLKAAIKEAGTTKLISVDVEGKTTDVLLKEVIRSLDRKSIVHADLYSVNENVKVKSIVPVKVTGESQLVVGGGVMVLGASSVEVLCLPKAIPSQLTVDATQLVSFSDILSAGSIEADEGIEIISNPKLMIAYVSQTRATREAAAAAKAE
ncbi:MAG: 50S ribosomal protein L25 [Lentisphaeraceae bacterium]|nr:50S ribosomal protein L25 [Lentisphaeraceae bacterium]